MSEIIIQSFAGFESPQFQVDTAKHKQVIESAWARSPHVHAKKAAPTEAAGCTIESSAETRKRILPKEV